MIHVNLPLPTSANNIWAPITRRFGRSAMIKTKEYKEWIMLAGHELGLQNPSPVPGRYTLEIYLPESMRGDTDNRVKAINDLLQRHSLVDNDKFMKRLVMDYDESIPNKRCKIFVFKNTKTKFDFIKIEQAARSLEKDIQAEFLRSRPLLSAPDELSQDSVAVVLAGLDK